MTGGLTELTASYAAQRSRLLARPGPSGTGRRRALADLTDEWLQGIISAAVPDPSGVALVAVGGYGRRELSPGSDLDLVLLHEGRADVAAIADAVFYPVWDSRLRLDHSVRRPAEARRVAAEDLPALLGLLDGRCVAGDSGIVDVLRGQVLQDWRAAAKSRLPALRESCLERAERVGGVAFALEPELKEGAGGLRDVHCLRAVAASWVADRPHGDLDGARANLLDVRDALHLVTGRHGDRLLQQEQDPVASRLGIADADSVLRLVASAARTVDYAAEVTWRRVTRVLAPRRRGLRLARPPRLVPLGGGLFEHEGELVLGTDAAAADPVLPLRAAATAAQHGLPLAPDTVRRLSGTPAMPEPWPAEARDQLVALLGAGRGAVPVWEALDQEGIITALLPEWGPVRSRPQRNAVHRWTVDRHLVETAVEASERARRVARPDLLLVGALLHDIGKGRRRGDHSREGAKLTRVIAARMGFDQADVEVLCDLVLHHLLLVDTATRRDLDDPATAAGVASSVRTASTLSLLHALTESDALATGGGVWTEWRSGLVENLVRRAGATLRGEDPAADVAPLAEEQQALVARVGATGEMVLTVTREGRHWTITVVAPDQRGLIAAAAGVLSLHRLSVRSADMRTEPAPPGTPREVALDTWIVVPEYDDEPRADRLREDLARALRGQLDVNGLLDRREAGRAARDVRVQPAHVEVVDGASRSATVLEVRAHDRPALLHRLGRALALSGLDVRAARVATMGAEVVDVFYVVDGDGHRLSADRARETARILRDVAG